VELLPAPSVVPRLDRVEAHPSISVDHLRRIGVVAPGTDDDAESEMVGWLRPRGERVMVAYYRDEEQIEVACEAGRASFRVAWTPCALGGQRAWLVCGDCERRRGRVYLVRGRWACRVCCGLRYDSSRLGRADREILRAARLRQRMGQHEAVPLGDPLPLPRKYTRARSYARLARKLRAAEMDALRLLART